MNDFLHITMTALNEQMNKLGDRITRTLVSADEIYLFFHFFRVSSMKYCSILALIVLYCPADERQTQFP